MLVLVRLALKLSCFKVGMVKALFPVYAHRFRETIYIKPIMYIKRFRRYPCDSSIFSQRVTTVLQSHRQLD